MRTIFLFLSFLCLIYSCKKKNIDPGIIVDNIDFGTCIPQTLPQQEYIVQSNSEYQLLLNSSVCQNYTTLPNIDFSQYTLLGKFASGQCKVTFKRQVTKDEANLKYNFTVYVFDKGLCKRQGQSMNWVIVPKLPVGWTVKYEIK